MDGPWRVQSGKSEGLPTVRWVVFNLATGEVWTPKDMADYPKSRAAADAVADGLNRRADRPSPDESRADELELARIASLGGRGFYV